MNNYNDNIVNYIVIKEYHSDSGGLREFGAAKIFEKFSKFAKFHFSRIFQFEGADAGTGLRPKNKFDLIFGNSGYASYDVWVSEQGTVSFTVELISSVSNSGDFVYVFIGNDLHNFESEKKTLSAPANTVVSIASFTWTLETGLHKMLITQGEKGVGFGALSITSTNANFHKTKGKNI
eukprot:Awhi_evm1s956